MRALSRNLRYIVQTPVGAIAVSLLCALVVVAIVAPSLWGVQAQALNIDHATAGASWAHVAGTDQVGRDVFKRVLVATRLSLELAVAAALLGSLLGVPVGAATGFLPLRLQRAVGRLINLGLAFPAVLVALFLTTIIGPGEVGALVAIGVALAPGFARTAQTLAASIGGSEFVAAARVVGVRRRRLLFRYVLPNISETLALQIAGGVSTALVAIAALSFLGLGVQPPSFDWGDLLAAGLKLIYVSPPTALVPGAAIVLAGLTFNLLGEGAAKALNPLLRARSGRQDAPPHAAAASSASPLEAAGALDGPAAPVLRVRNLSVSFDRGGRAVEVVSSASLDVGPGEIVGVVGESGSGKTMLSLAIAGLVPHPGRVEADELEFAGRDLLSTPRAELQALLGTKLSVVFQDPMSSLTPVLKIGRQLTEAVRFHERLGRRQADELALRRLADVHVSSPRRRLAQYPHEFSGGMRQRAMIAMGLMGSPELIVADEPTTALDVTVQAQILDLLQELNRTQGTAVIFVSHDLAVIRQLCHRVFVLYAGRIVESGPVDAVVGAPMHPYTKALLDAVPSLDVNREQPLVTIPGRPPHPASLPPGCAFAPRCPLAFDRCRHERPPLERYGDGRVAACWAAAEARAHAGQEARPA